MLINDNQRSTAIPMKISDNLCSSTIIILTALVNDDLGQSMTTTTHRRGGSGAAGAGAAPRQLDGLVGRLLACLLA
eukprot:11154804-Lingulodinium_polyedra.AAC.1